MLAIDARRHILRILGDAWPIIVGPHKFRAEFMEARTSFERRPHGALHISGAGKIFGLGQDSLLILKSMDVGRILKMGVELAARPILKTRWASAD